MKYKVIHQPSQKIIAQEVKQASSFYDRLIGLMFKNEMQGYDGLLLEPCKSIHNFFVRFSIDVLFLDKNNKIVAIIHSFKPWRITKFYFKAQKVLELKSGTLFKEIKVGDQIEVQSV